ncbi:hypothetical protein [Nostoc sphaeroides]|nr:hypothetical protein [Nostoc sphaeroides]
MNHTKDTLQNRSDFGAFIPAFLDDYPLESEEFRLYAHIQRRAGGQGCFESIPKMAQHCYMALKTAKNALKLLLATGMLTIEERPGTTNIYTLTPKSEWVEPEQVNLLREQIKIKKESQVKNDPSQICTGVKNDPSPKDIGGGVKFAPPSGVKNAWGVGSNLTYEGIPIKDIPVKVLPLKDAPLASPPAPPTQESVCEKEKLVLTTKEIELEESTPQQPTSLRDAARTLLKKSESSQQTDNPSCRSTIAAGSFEKSEQSNNQLVALNPKSASPTSLPDSTCYTMHPTEKTEQAMRVSGLPPWMDKAGPNGWKAEFVESYRQYLNSTPRYAKELIRQATTGEAKNALTPNASSNHWRRRFYDSNQYSMLLGANSTRHRTDGGTALESL